MTAPSPLFEPLTLPNGAVLSNRIAKASMEENMAAADQLPGPSLLRLYEAWADGGAGLILTGNAMVDPRALTGPAGVVLDARQPLEPFRAWARAALRGGAHAWMQINHPGRQTPASLGQGAVGPSAVGLEMPGAAGLFPVPRALEPAEIAEVVERFAVTAALAEAVGFTGVQVHAAHGYLLSQFLSPLVNRRTDAWGGSLDNRARLLFDCVRAIRTRVSRSFCVSVKLNSADFQKGGFEPAEATEVVRRLGELAVDLVELSGGSYESPAMQGAVAAGSTLAREAYFIDFARDIGVAARMPIMVTGGVRRRTVAEQALQPLDGRPGIAVVGIARAMAIAPDLPERWRRDEAVVELPVDPATGRMLGGAAGMAAVKAHLRAVGAGRDAASVPSPARALAISQARMALRARRYRRWMAERSASAA